MVGKLRLTRKQFAKFSKTFANLSTNLVNNLPTPTNLFGIDSINTYYAKLNLQNKTKFSLQPITRSIILKIIEDIDPSKAVGIDNIGGGF